MNATPCIVVVMNGKRGIDSENLQKELNSAEIADRNNEGLVLLKWRVPPGITAGTEGPGSLQIAVFIFSE
jgi:hypothetical protein